MMAVLAQEIERISVIAQRNILNQTDLVEDSNHVILSSEFNATSSTIAGSLLKIPGLSLNGQGGLLQSYSLRGFSRWRIRTEVDGVPIITDRQAGNSASFIAPSLLNSITVKQGPSSTLYGSGAMGGLVDLSSQLFDGLSLSAGYQFNDQLKQTMIAYGNDDISTAVVSRKAENAKDGNGDELNSAYEQVSGLFKYQQHLGDLDIEFSWLPSYGSNIGKSSSKFPYLRISEYPQETHSLSQIQVMNKQSWLVKFYHHYQDWQSSVKRINQRQNLTNYQAHTLGGSYIKPHQLLNGQGRVGFDWLGRRGVLVSEKEFDGKGEYQFSNKIIDGQQDNLAIFVDDHWRFNDVKFSLGLRYDWIIQKNQNVDKQSPDLKKYPKRVDSQFNTSLGVNWLINSNWELKSELGTGFRFPTLTELYFDGETPRGTTIGNTFLKPEKSLGIQVSLAYTLVKSVNVKLNSYHYDLDNYIEHYSLEKKIKSYRNLDSAYIEGFDLSLNWRLSDMLHQSLSYQWQRGKDNNQDVLADLNPNKWLWQTIWQNDRLSINNNLSYQLVKANVGSGEQITPAVLLWSLSAQWQLSSHRHIQLYGNNLLDKVYFPSADEDSAIGQGLTLGFKFTWQYE